MALIPPLVMISVPEKGTAVLDSPSGAGTAVPAAAPVAVARVRKAPAVAATPQKGWIRKVEFGYDTPFLPKGNDSPLMVMAGATPLRRDRDRDMVGSMTWP